jgi:hemin uptake protein HemP
MPARPDESSKVDKAAPMRVPLASLLGERTEIILIHNDEEYRLRITSRGKLILTK